MHVIFWFSVHVLASRCALFEQHKRRFLSGWWRINLDTVSACHGVSHCLSSCNRDLTDSGAFYVPLVTKYELCYFFLSYAAIEFRSFLNATYNWEDFVKSIQTYYHLRITFVWSVFPRHWAIRSRRFGTT